MAVYAGVANQVAALKELYTGDDYMKDLVYAKNPLLALVPKDESPSGFAGKYIPVPLQYGTPQGRSANFVKAQNNQTPPQLASFFVYRVKNYQLATIENELLEATRDDAGSFVREAKQVVDGAIKNISNDLAFDLYRDGRGVRGVTLTTSSQTGGTAASGVVLPLSQAADIVNFEVGMVLVAAATAGGTPSTDTVTITKVDRSAGIVTGTASAATLSGAWGIGTAAAYIGVDGDMQASASGMLKVSGLAAWLPVVAPTTGDSFWGVDRSADPTRMGGVRFDGQTQTIEEGLIDAASLVAREGGQPDMCFMSFGSYAALEKSLGSKVQYVSVKHDEAEIAFAGITINAPYGPITCIPDRNCPPKLAYLLDMATIKFRSLGKAPHALTYGAEGLDGIRVSNADALEMRWGYYGNLICNAPGWNCVVQLSQ